MDVEKLKSAIGQKVFVVMEHEGVRNHEYGKLLYVVEPNRIEVYSPNCVTSVSFGLILIIYNKEGLVVYERN